MPSFFIYQFYFSEPKIFFTNFSWGDKHYEGVIFVPLDNKSTSFDGVSFTYEGNRTITDNQCSSADMNYDVQYHANEIKKFKIMTKDGQIIISDLCWPVPRVGQPCHTGPHGGIGCPPPSEYTVSWFDKNQTTGLAYCVGNGCELNPSKLPRALFLVEKH